MYLGLDSSTQSCSATIIDPTSGSITYEGSVNFGTDLPQYNQPNGFIPGGENGEVHSNPLMWLDAMDLLFAKMKEAGVDFSSIKGLSGSGQQHGSVYLNAKFTEKLTTLDPELSLAEQLKDTLARSSSPIWMDTSTSTQCQEVAAAVGGNEVVCAKSGSIAIERFTGSQIRKFAQESPQEYANTTQIHLVSSFLCSALAGKPASIDTGDGAGMNLLNLASSDWDSDLVHATAEGLMEKLPRASASTEIIGKVAPYFVEKYGFNADCEVMAWSGDNPCSLVGMGAAQPGVAVISLGTSDTLFAAMPEAVTDPNGYGHVFGNPMGGYMSLICFLNGSLAREAVKEEYGLSWDDFGPESMAQTPVGNGGSMMLPFFGNEITPRLDSDAPIYNRKWSVQDEAQPAKVIRATLEGQFLNMKAQSDWMGISFNGIRVTGGASQNDGICQVIADVFGCPISRLETTGSAALGAALKSATADGHDLSALEEAFCQTGKTVLPNAESVAIYQELSEEYAELLSIALNPEDE